MTSLAKQLERLAVPHIRAVYSEDKRRKSLLFDPKEAAALDKEAIYALGILHLCYDMFVRRTISGFSLSLLICLQCYR